MTTEHAPPHASPSACRSPARTPAAAPASRPTSRRSRAAACTGRRRSPRSPRRTPSAVTRGRRRRRRTMIVAQVSAVADDIGVDAVKIGMLGDGRDDRGRRRGARLLPAGDAGRRRPGDGRRVRRARCSTPTREDALSELSCRARPSSRRTSPRRACSRGATTDARRRGARARASTRSARARSSSPAGTATRRPTCFFDGDATSRDPRPSATPTAPRTARAARTPRRSPPISRSATAARGGARGRARSPRRRSRTACATSARAPGRSTCSASAERPAEPRPPCHNRPMTWKFLRMKPGHGEVLLAEGDVDVPRGGAARRGVPPPARRGHVGRRARPPPRPAAARREMVKAFDESRATPSA